MRKKYINFLTIGILAICFPSVSPAQEKNINHGTQWWLRYYNRIEFSEKWNMVTEIDNRRFFDPDRQNTFLIRAQGLYNFNKNISAVAGVSYFQQSQDLGEFGIPEVPEIRPHQEVNIKQNIGKMNVLHRYKIEERFIRNINDGQLTDGCRFNFRFRYQLGIDITLLKKLKLRIYDEILLNAGKSIQYNFFDQNRVYAGLNYEIMKGLAIEAGYMHWFQQRASGKDFNSWDILRFTIYHSISLTKKES